MRILWMKVGGLWPVNTGGRLRSFQILSELARRHNVVLLTTHAPGEDPRALSSALAACEAVHAVPYSIPKMGSARFATSVARSWFSPYPVDLWKCRVPALREKAREEPEVSLTVVGRNPTEPLRAAAAAAGVRVTGTVEDVRPSIAEAEVYVVPLRIGGGTRLKIFEALAMGKPVVSTTVGAEGLPLTSGRHVLLADEPAAFARAVVSLLRHPEERRAP